MSNIVLSGNATSMTLKEITDLINVRHDRAMLKAEKMAENPEFGTMSKMDIVYNDRGQTIETLILDKRQSIAVASVLNTALLMRVIDRWQELEGTDAKPASLKPVTMPKVAADFRAKKSLAKACKLSDSEALIAANSWTERDFGVNVLSELGIKSLESESPSLEVTGTEVGEALGLPGNGSGKAQNLNLGLWDIGYLEVTLDSKGKPKWEVTGLGKESRNIDYCNVEKLHGKRSSVQSIKYFKALIDDPLLKGFAGLDFNDLKERKKAAIAKLREDKAS